MKEIIELNNRLVGQLGKSSSDGVLMLGRNGQPEELKRLPVGFQAEIEAFRAKVNEVVPNDFDWALSLGDDSPGFTIEYNDGPQTGFFRGRDWESGRCIIEQLKDFDWEGERHQAISGCQMFDDIRANAEHSPSRLPPTKEIQKAFRDEMKEFVKTKCKDVLRVHVMLWRDDEEVKEEAYEDMKSFCQELPAQRQLHAHAPKTKFLSVRRHPRSASTNGRAKNQILISWSVFRAIRKAERRFQPCSALRAAASSRALRRSSLSVPR